VLVLFGLGVFGDVSPADAVAFGGGAGLAALAAGGGFEGAASTDFLHDPLGVEFRFEAFEGAVDGLAFFDGHASICLVCHALV